MAEKILANPAQIAGLLVFDRHTRPQARMDEQIVADLDPIFEGREKGDMRRRHPLLKQHQQLIIIHIAILLGRNAIAEQRLAAADADEKAQRAQIPSHGAEEDLLMIAQKEANRSLFA